MAQQKDDIENPRPDYQISEEDLWVEPPHGPAGVEYEQRSLK